MPYFRISQKDFKSSFNIMFLEFLKLPQKSVGPSQFLPLGSTHFLGPSSPGFSPFPWPIFPGLSPRPKPPLATLQRQHALQDVHTSRPCPSLLLVPSCMSRRARTRAPYRLLTLAVARPCCHATHPCRYAARPHRVSPRPSDALRPAALDPSAAFKLHQRLHPPSGYKKPSASPLPHLLLSW